MRKKPQDRILKGEPKEQHLSTILKSCSFENMQFEKVLPTRQICIKLTHLICV